MGQQQVTLDHILAAADCNACRFTENGAVWLWNEDDDGNEIGGAVIVSIRDGKVYTGTCADYIGDWRVPDHLRHAELSATPEDGETAEEAALAICEEYIHPILAVTENGRRELPDRIFGGVA